MFTLFNTRSFVLALSLVAACDPSSSLPTDEGDWDTAGAATVTPEPADDGALMRATPTQVGLHNDVTGDGVEDLVIGLPGEGAPGEAYGGYIEVFRGISGAGAGSALSMPTAALWSQSTAGIIGDIQDGEEFGYAVTLTDLDCDDRADVIIGLPFSDVAGTTDGGAIQVIRGGGTLLTATQNRLWDQDDLVGSAGDQDHLGMALTANDFDADGCGELVVAAPDDGGQGSVTVVWGSAVALSEVPPLFTADFPAVARRYLAADLGLPVGTGFGAAMVSADFNRDNEPDLVIAAPRHDVSLKSDSGAVSVIYNVDRSAAPSGHKQFTLNTTGVDGSPDSYDGFGTSLAAGDFNCDGYADLAVGAPKEKVGGVDSVGAVHVLYGGASGLSGVADQWFYQGLSGKGGTAASGDRFGAALASGDFNGDRCADLAIGSPGEGSADRGQVQVVMGSTARLKWTGVKTLVQPTAEHEDYDEYGSVLAVGDYNDDGLDELVVGIPKESVGVQDDAGAVRIYYWSSGSLSISQVVSQATTDVAGDAEAQDRFGFGLPR